MHEVLAVFPAVKGAATKIAAETAKVFQGKHEHFEALHRAYEPFKEGEEHAEPDEVAEMATTVGEKLSHLAEIFGPAIDAGFQIDTTNMVATGTIEVDGLKLEGVPATFLMQLDKRLNELRGVYQAIPTLDPKFQWGDAADRGAGVFKANDEVRYRTEKQFVHKVVVEPTENHPAQIDKWAEDKRIGKYVTQRWSGRISVRQKYEVLKRIDTLQKAVKRALSEANSIEHSDGTIADKLFAFINGDIPLSRAK